MDTSFSLSKEIPLVNLTNILKCLLVNIFLLIGQTSVFTTVDIKLFFMFSSSHLYNKWSIVWSLVPYGQVGVSTILNQCKYDLIFPCPVTMDVKLWVMIIFIFSLCQLLPGSILLWFVLLLFVQIPLSLHYTYLTKVTYHYTFWNSIILLSPNSSLPPLRVCRLAHFPGSWRELYAINIEFPILFFHLRQFLLISSMRDLWISLFLSESIVI